MIEEKAGKKGEKKCLPSRLRPGRPPSSQMALRDRSSGGGRKGKDFAASEKEKREDQFVLAGLQKKNVAISSKGKEPSAKKEETRGGHSGGGRRMLADW